MFRQFRQYLIDNVKKPLDVTEEKHNQNIYDAVQIILNFHNDLNDEQKIVKNLQSSLAKQYNRIYELRSPEAFKEKENIMLLGLALDHFYDFLELMEKQEKEGGAAFNALGWKLKSELKETKEEKKSED